MWYWHRTDIKFSGTEWTNSGIPSPLAASPGWGAWCGAKNLHNSARTSLISLFSRLWVSHPEGIGFDIIVIVPLLLFCCGFSFVLGCGVSFFGGFQCLPVDGCSMASCSFGALKEDIMVCSQVLIGHSYIFFGKISIQIFCLFYKFGYLLSYYWVVSVFWIKSFVRHMT